MKHLSERSIISMVKGMQPPLAEGFFGIGDDAALLPANPQGWLVSQDMLVEGVHFRRDWSTPWQVGVKAAQVNLSDIAAMAGCPRAALTSLAVPPSTTPQFVESLYQGLTDAFRPYGVVVVGGDTVASPDRIVLDVAILGTPSPQGIAWRRGAQPGDHILVSGNLGSSRAGLELLRQGARWPGKDSDENEALRAHLTPQGRVALGAALAGWVHAMTDVSDDLAVEIAALVEDESLGADVWIEKLPISKGTRAIAGRLGAPPEWWALFGGEDYELLMLAPPANLARVLMIGAECGVSMTEIGVVRADGRICWLNQGRPMSLPEEGLAFDHFSP